MAEQSYDSSFRTWQAIADLIHHVKPLLGTHLGTVARAMGVSPREAGVAVGLLRDDGFAFKRDATLNLLDGLENLAIARGDGFDLAVVVLLADVLQSRVGTRVLDDVWPEAALRLRGWPATLRAAVANGLVRARELGLVALDTPDPASCLTRPASEISEHLLQIARSMRREELVSVAQADYGHDTERHLVALQACLSLRDGIFLPEEFWYPSEVVELRAHVPGYPGHVGCTAILLLNVLKNGDQQDWFGFRWQRQAAAYCELKPSQRDPILAAIRHIHETDENFLANETVDFNPAQTDGRTIPVVDDL